MAMHQERLFRLAFSGIQLGAYYEGAEGWHVVIRMRRDDELWADVEPVHYHHLTSVEMLDVISAHLGSELGV